MALYLPFFSYYIKIKNQLKLKNVKLVKKVSVGLILLLITFVAFVGAIYLLNYNEIKAISNAEFLFDSDLEQISGTVNSKFIKTHVNVTTGTKSYAKIEFKLFDIFKIKSKTMEVVNDRDLLISGDVVAMELDPGGLIITKINEVETADGKQKSIDGNLLVGDVITHVNSTKLDNAYDLQNVILTGEPLVLTIARSGKKLEVSAMPKLEKSTELYRLGLTVDDNICGIGTLTFVDELTNKFGALGHSISNNTSLVTDGKIVRANIIGVEKGTLGRAGEIKAYETFGASNTIGEVEKCSNKGVFGVIKNSEYIKNFIKLKSGGRFSVVPGDAQIICDVDGTGAKAYNIKIIKAAKQEKADVKGIVIKVTDKKLLAKTGGIVQGMSGSPIIQNGRLVGAVTHVFLNDSTKGYGIYLDSMLNEIDL